MWYYRTDPLFRAAVDELVQESADTLCDLFGVPHVDTASILPPAEDPEGSDT
jgi:hypothetical protein